jgi:hypothetical protein
MSTRATTSQNIDRAWPDAYDRRRRSSSGSRSVLRTSLELGHHEKLIGINPATKWSPELAPVNPSAAVHGGHTSILSYGAWNDSKIIWEGAYAHPEADANLADVGDGRRWVNHHGFRWATGKGNDQILKIASTKAWFLSLGCYSSSSASPSLFHGPRDDLNRRRRENSGEVLHSGAADV